MKKKAFIYGETLDMYDNYDYDPGYNATGVLPNDVKAQPHIGQNIGHSNIDINFDDDCNDDDDSFDYFLKLYDSENSERMKKLLKIFKSRK